MSATPTRFKSPPPKVAADGSTAASFVAAAPRKERYPWDEPHVRDDLRMELNSKQPERLMLKITWLARMLGSPKRDIIEIALTEYFEREARRLGVGV